jgi:hypothetical protein
MNSNEADNTKMSISSKQNVVVQPLCSLAVKGNKIPQHAQLLS